MGRSLTICALIMAIVLGLVGWLQPGSFMMWFAASAGQIALFRWLTAGLLVGLLAADSFADYWPVRWAAAATSLVFAWQALLIFMDHSVYILDCLVAALTAVCSAMIAMQPGAHRARDSRALQAIKGLVLRAPTLAKQVTAVANYQSAGRYRHWFYPGPWQLGGS